MELHFYQLITLYIGINLIIIIIINRQNQSNNFYNEYENDNSSWSRAGFINTGIFPRKILNIPLGVNSNIYYELSKKQKIKKRIEILNQGEEDDDGDDDK